MTRVNRRFSRVSHRDTRCGLYKHANIEHTPLYHPIPPGARRRHMFVHAIQTWQILLYETPRGSRLNIGHEASEPGGGA